MIESGKQEIGEYKELLAVEIEYTAEWRQEKADEYPQDERNVQSAKALSALAEKIRALDNKSAGLQALYDLDRGIDPNRVSDWSDAKSMVIGRYGFDSPVDDPGPEDFLAELAKGIKGAIGRLST